MLPVIQALAGDSHRTRAQVTAAAVELGYGTTRVYALLQRYAGDPTLTSLLPQRRGPVPGRSRLSSEMDTLIALAVAQRQVQAAPLRCAPA